MNAKGIFTSMTAALVLGAFACVQADAATIMVKCEKRANRSKASVHSDSVRPGVYYGSTTPGLYRCRVQSGANVAITPLKQTVANGLDCYFDSDSSHIAAGATRIPANFIQGGRVTGKILNRRGFTVISDTSVCAVR